MLRQGVGTGVHYIRVIFEVKSLSPGVLEEVRTVQVPLCDVFLSFGVSHKSFHTSVLFYPRPPQGCCICIKTFESGKSIMDVTSRNRKAHRAAPKVEYAYEKHLLKKS